MDRKKFLKIVSGVLCGCLLGTSMLECMGVMKVQAQKVSDAEWGLISSILDSYPGIYTEDTPLGSPWDTGYSPDGPLMGNGTVYAFMAGDHKTQNLYISHSNMWQDRTSDDGQEYTTFGGITIKEAVTDSSRVQDFCYQQDMKNAEVTAQSEQGFTTKSWLSAKENIIVTEIMNEADYVLPMEVSAWTANANKNAEIQENTMIETKVGISEAKPDRPSGNGTWEGWIVNVAMASKIIDDIEKEVVNVREGKNATKFSLDPGQTVTLVSAVEGGKEEAGENTMDRAIEKAVNKLNTRTTQESLDTAKEKHREYWKDYWLKSYIDIQDKKIERMYYGMLYQLGCSTSVSSENNGGIAAGLFPWTAVDHPDWQGDYTTNTDFQRQIHPLITANRTSGIQNYINIVNQYWPEAQRRSSSVEHLNWVIDGTPRQEKFTEGIPDGALFPTHIGPWGASTEQYDDDRDYWNSPADATSVLMPIIKLWKYTQDDELLKEIYPMMKSVSTFWENYVTLEDGQYVVYGATHEGITGRNPILDVDACIYMLKNTITAANQLGIDGDRIQIWQNILDYMSEVPTMVYNGKTTICDVEGRTQSNPGSTFWDNPVPIQSVYYFDSIGMSASEEDKEKYINYLDVKNGLGNHRRLISATRLGYYIHEIMDQLKAGAIDPKPSNWEGLRGNNTIGDIGTVGRMAIIQDSLLQSNEGFINIFANWYDDQETSFRRLNAENAFLVDGDMNEFGQVTYANIQSEKGRKCSVLNPWQKQDLKMEVYQNGEKIKTKVTQNSLGDLYTFDTKSGESYELKPAGELPSVIDISEEDTELFIEDTLQLIAKTNAEDQIVWKSSDESIAKVENGLVTPLKLGEVKIAASLEKNELVSDMCTVYVVDEKRIPSNELSAVADSEENSGGDGPGSNAVDGNEGTFWHSGYSNGKAKPDIPNNLNNSITIDLENTYSVSHLDYVPRQDNSSNGTISKYEIWYSTKAEGDDFTKVSEGSWEINKETQTAKFDPVSCQRIRLRAMETYGGSEDSRNQWISAAEFYIYKMMEKEWVITGIITEIPQIKVPVDTSWENLISLLPKEVEVELSTGARTTLPIEWKPESYTEESGTVIGEPVCSDKITNPNHVQVEAEIVVEEIDKEILKDLYNQYISMEQGMYTYESWNALQEELKYARSILDREDASTSEILDAKTRLESAVTSLKEIEGIELGGEEITVYLGIPQKLVARNNTEKELVWSSSDESVATVDEDGVITPLSKGTTTITVRVEGTGYDDTCQVMVQRNERNYNMENPTFTESGHHENFVPEKVADGKTGGEHTEYAWVSPNVPITEPRWIAVSFPEPVTINKWRVTHADVEGNGKSITKDFELQISEDGLEWESVDSITDNKQLVNERIFDSNEEISARNFRIYITGADNYNGEWPNNMARIDEWELVYEYGNYYAEFQPGNGMGDVGRQEFRYNEEKALNKNTFTREGYIFDCWMDEAGNQYADEEEVLNLTPENGETVVLTAQWKPINYQISYDLNQGEGKVPESITCAYDAEVTLASTDGITWGGYEITGWNTKSNGTGTDYAGGVTVSNLTTKDGEDIVLYAKWEKVDSISKKTLKRYLTEAKEHVANGDTEGLIESVRKMFEEAIAQGEAIMADENTTEEEVRNATLKLMYAIQSLDFRLGDKTDLGIALELTTAIDLSRYIETGKAEYETAKVEAERILKSNDVLQEEVDTAWNALVETMLNLRLKADKSALAELIHQAETIDTGLYTHESVTPFKSTLENARAIMADETLSVEEQDKVDQSAIQLDGAINALQLKEKDNNNGGSNNSGNTEKNKGNSNSGKTGNNSKGNTQKKAVKTGDMTSVLEPVMGMGISFIFLIAGVIFVRRKG